MAWLAFSNKYLLKQRLKGIDKHRVYTQCTLYTIQYTDCPVDKTSQSEYLTISGPIQQVLMGPDYWAQLYNMYWRIQSEQKVVGDEDYPGDSEASA